MTDLNLSQDKTKGVLIIALGHSQYGIYAWNLAVTMHLADPNLKITLVWSGNALSYYSDKMKDIFDQIIECPYEYTHLKDQFIGVRPKLFAYQLSPYDETLYVDADSLWFRKVSHNQVERTPTMLIDHLSGLGDFAVEHKHVWEISGRHWGCQWTKTPEKCTFPDLIDLYKIPAENKATEFQSSLMFFKKTDENLKFFLTAREIFDDLRLNRLDQVHRWGESVPDELAFNLASAKVGLICSPSPMEYVCFREHHDLRAHAGNSSFLELTKRFWMQSMAGNQLVGGYVGMKAVQLYDQLGLAANAQFGTPFGKWRDKKDFAPERSKL